jgi:hypothetical protein
MRFKWREINAEILAIGLNRKKKKVAVQHYVFIVKGGGFKVGGAIGAVAPGPLQNK